MELPVLRLEVQVASCHGGSFTAIHSPFDAAFGAGNDGPLQTECDLKIIGLSE
jgi:hypothetical protein